MIPLRLRPQSHAQGTQGVFRALSHPRWRPGCGNTRSVPMAPSHRHRPRDRPAGPGGPTRGPGSCRRKTPGTHQEHARCHRCGGGQLSRALSSRNRSAGETKRVLNREVLRPGQEGRSTASPSRMLPPGTGEGAWVHAASPQLKSCPPFLPLRAPDRHGRRPRE